MLHGLILQVHRDLPGLLCHPCESGMAVTRLLQPCSQEASVSAHSVTGRATEPTGDMHAKASIDLTIGTISSAPPRSNTTGRGETPRVNP
jgi:hypothetical protein